MGHHQHNARVQRVLSTNGLSISPQSSKGDGWGVGRGRQVFCPVTFPCPPQPQSDLHQFFIIKQSRGFTNGISRPPRERVCWNPYIPSVSWSPRYEIGARASQRIQTRTPDRQTQPTTDATNDRAARTIVVTLLFTLNSKHVLS